MNSIPVKAINLSKEMGIDVLYDNYEYKLLSGGGYYGDIDKPINKHIQEGWKLYGNLVVVHNGGQGNNSTIYQYQGMIRKLPAKGGNRTRRNR